MQGVLKRSLEKRHLASGYARFHVTDNTALYKGSWVTGDYLSAAVREGDAKIANCNNLVLIVESIINLKINVRL